jgi:tetratricopeptide (TPR) repeat protein
VCWKPRLNSTVYIQGLFDEAESNLERADDLAEKAKVTDKLSSAKELASLKIQLGKYSETDRLLIDLIEDYEKIFGPNTLRLIEPLVNKGRILLATGDYTEAEKTALRANQIAVKTYGDNSTKTAPTQKLLSEIYSTLGDYQRAEANVLKALSSQEKLFGRNHIETAKSISALALIKFHKGDSKQNVEKLMLESQTIMVAKLGPDNPQYAEILKNVAILYISEKKYDIAFNSLTKAEAIWRAKTGTKNNVNAASIYTLTGDVYYQLKNYKKAEEFYGQAKDLYEKFFNRNHPEYVKVLSKLAKVHYMKKEYKTSKKLIEESLGNYESYIKEYFPALSEAQKAKFWNTIKGDFEF